MISAWLKRRKSMRNAATGLYQAAVTQSRDPLFYTDLGVADTLDGRFDLVTLHVFLIMNRLSALGADGKALSQALFDHMFTNMDLTLRQIGIGDMGIPKHMKRMMRAFNGRVHNYHTALNGTDKQELELAVSRNIYRHTDGEIPAAAAYMVEYISRQSAWLMRQDYESLAAGRVTFVDVATQSKKHA